jgi:hypothetical protein
MARKSNALVAQFMEIYKRNKAAEKANRKFSETVSEADVYDVPGAVVLYRRMANYDQWMANQAEKFAEFHR